MLANSASTIFGHYLKTSSIRRMTFLPRQLFLRSRTHGSRHGHGHGVFILAMHPKGKWTTNPKPSFTQYPTADSVWGRCRESCSGPLHAWECGRSSDDLPFSVLWNKQTASKPRSPTVPQTVLVCRMCFVCMCKSCNLVTSSVLFVFVFTCALCPCVYFPMSLSCILCSYKCTALFPSIHSSVWNSLFTGHRLCFSINYSSITFWHGITCIFWHVKDHSTIKIIRNSCKGRERKNPVFRCFSSAIFTQKQNWYYDYMDVYVCVWKIHTHTLIYICVCVCMCVHISVQFIHAHALTWQRPMKRNT